MTTEATTETAMPKATARRVAAAMALAGAFALLASVPAGAETARSPIQVRSCQQQVGPFNSQYQAYQMLREAQARGYSTGPVYGQGGIYSNAANRRYFFTVYYAC